MKAREEELTGGVRGVSTGVEIVLLVQGRFAHMCSEFKCQTAGFPGAKLPCLYRCSCNCTHVEAQAPVERVSTCIVDVDTQTVTTAKTGARLGVACPPVHSLVTSVYTLNVILD